MLACETWPAREWVLSPSSSSYGRWALRQGEATIRFFWKKEQAVRFWNDAKRDEA